jgi:hypothetical protein
MTVVRAMISRISSAAAAAAAPDNLLHTTSHAVKEFLKIRFPVLHTITQSTDTAVA